MRTLQFFLLPIFVMTTLPSLAADSLDAQVEVNADSSGAQRSAFLLGYAIKAHEEIRNNPTLRDNLAAGKVHMQAAINEAIAAHDGTSLRNGDLEWGMKGGVLLMEGFTKKLTRNENLGKAVGYVGNKVVEKALDQFASDPASFDYHPLTTRALRKEGYKIARDQNDPYSDDMRKIIQSSEQRDPRQIIEQTSADSDFESKKRNMLLLTENQPKVHEKIEKARSKAEVSQSLQELAAEHINDIESQAERARKNLSGIGINPQNNGGNSILMNDYFDRQKQKERQLDKDRISDTFGALRAAAMLNDDNDFAAGMLGAGQVGVGIYELATMTAEQFAENPAKAFSTGLMVAGVAHSLLTAGQRQSEMAGVMKALQALQKAIADLHRDMMEQFSLLNQKLDGYFLRTFDSLGRIEGGEALQMRMLQDISKNLLELRAQVADGFQESVLRDANKTLNACLGHSANTLLPFNLRFNQEENQFQECRNWLANAALGNYGELKIEENVGNVLYPSGVVRYLYDVGSAVAADEFPSANQVKVHPADWFWATDKILRMARLHPQYVSSILKDSGLDSPSLSDVIAAGESLKKFSSSIGMQNGSVRGEVFRKIISDYKEEVMNALDANDEAYDSKNNAGPRVGLSFAPHGYGGEAGEQHQLFYLKKGEDTFLNINMPMCNRPGDKPGAAEVKIEPKFDPPIVADSEKYRNRFQIFKEDAGHILAFPREGLPMTDEFARFIPDSVMFAARESARGLKGSPYKIEGCFRRWEITKAGFTGNSNFVELAVTVRLQLRYIRDGKPVELPLVDLDAVNFGETWGVNGQFYFRDTEHPYGQTLWRGGSAHSDQKPLEALNRHPEKFTVSRPIDWTGLAQFEKYYSRDLRKRDETAWKALQKVLHEPTQKTVMAKAALIYLLKKYQGDNFIVARFYKWLMDPTHFADARTWSAIYFNSKQGKDKFVDRLDDEVRIAETFVAGLQRSSVLIGDSYELSTRLEQLRQLEKAAQKPSTGARVKSFFSKWW